MSAIYRLLIDRAEFDRYYVVDDFGLVADCGTNQKLADDIMEIARKCENPGLLPDEYRHLRSKLRGLLKEAGLED